MTANEPTIRDRTEIVFGPVPVALSSALRLTSFTSNAVRLLDPPRMYKKDHSFRGELIILACLDGLFAFGVVNSGFHKLGKQTNLAGVRGGAFPLP